MGADRAFLVCILLRPRQSRPGLRDATARRGMGADRERGDSPRRGDRSGLSSAGELFAGSHTKGTAVTKRILVVDDRAVLLDLLRRILEDEDEQYKVSVLQEGRNAVETIRRDPPDLVILDL